MGEEGLSSHCGFEETRRLFPLATNLQCFWGKGGPFSLAAQVPSAQSPPHTPAQSPPHTPLLTFWTH